MTLGGSLFDNGKGDTAETGNGITMSPWGEGGGIKQKRTMDYAQQRKERARRSRSARGASGDGMRVGKGGCGMDNGLEIDNASKRERESEGESEDGKRRINEGQKQRCKKNQRIDRRTSS